MMNMQGRSWLGVRFLATGLAISLGGCSSIDINSPAISGDDVKGDDTSLIGGVEANAASLDAIGTVGVKDEDGNYFYFCSATLIGPSTVLTAKHCAIVLDDETLGGMKLVNLTEIYFAVGADATRPKKLVEAIAANTAPVEEGGLVGLGNDVAVYHLVEPITDVKPITVAAAALTDRDIGRKYTGVGYGSKDILEDLSGELQGHRLAGTVTLQALKGKAFELMLGSFDAFVAQLVSIYGQEMVDEAMDEVRAMFDETVILENYEFWAGNAAGDAQTCHGDSGGPLLGRVKTAERGVEKQIFGVVSGGWFSKDLTCDYGTFYAGIGPKTQEMIAAGMKYVDPCSGLSSQGRCDGTTATRCSAKFEGERRLLAVDCASLDLTCGKDDKGQVACVDATLAPPSHVDPADGRTPPSPGGVRRAVRSAARRGVWHRAIQLLDRKLATR